MMPPIRGNELPESRPPTEEEGNIGRNERYPTYRSTPTDATPVEYARRRAAIACELCRARKTRCDGVKPQCGFCKEINHDCIYRPAPTAPPSRLERDINKIFEKLEDLSFQVQAQQVPPKSRQSPNVIETPHSTESLSSKDEPSPEPISSHPLYLVKDSKESSELQETTIQDSTPYAMMCYLHKMAKLPFQLPDWLHKESIHMQGPIPLPLGLSPPPSPDPEEIQRLFNVYFSKVHIWFPILDPTTTRYRLTVLRPDFGSTEHCMFLMILALGSIAQNDKVHNWASQYASPALSMLSVVCAKNDITAVQCLILISLYYSYLVQPAQVFNYVGIASLKIQHLVYWRTIGLENTFGNPEDRELERRAFWAIYLIEKFLSSGVSLTTSEHRVCYVNPGSRLDTYEDQIGLPFGVEDPFLRSSTSHGMDATYLQAAFYFLAAIRMRQSLNRGHKEVRRPGTKEDESFQPRIVAALDEEVDKWYNALPAPIKFDRNFSVDTFPTYGTLAPPVPDPVAFLRTQCIATKIAFYWPAVYSILSSSKPLDQLPEYRAAVVTSVTAVMRWIASSDQFLSCRFTPQAWTLSQALYAATLSTVVIIESPKLRDLVPSSFMQWAERALHTLEAFAEFSPSIGSSYAMLRAKLESVQKLLY